MDRGNESGKFITRREESQRVWDWEGGGGGVPRKVSCLLCVIKKICFHTFFAIEKM